MEGMWCWAMFTKPLGFQPLNPSQDLSSSWGTGLTNPWCLIPVEAAWVCGQQKVFLLAWCPLLATLPAVSDCSALIWHLGPAAHWDCLPTFALLRSFMSPGCPWGRSGGAEAPQTGEGPLLLLSPSFPPSLAGDPEPSDDTILHSWPEKRT